MKVIGLNGQEHYWNFIKYKPHKKCSKLHLRARKLLTKEFPCEIIYEELALPGTKTERQTTLFADFFIPTKYIIIEVQGEQHYKFNNFFYDNKLEFFQAQSRDRNKKEWCQINNILLIELPFNENDQQWLQRIRNRL